MLQVNVFDVNISVNRQTDGLFTVRW